MIGKLGMENNSKEPIVSVIMNCLNCDKYLGEAIDSVFAQTYKNWEIIFWDNASTDQSPEIAKSYGERVRYFRGDKICPLGKARNLAIAKARGEYIAFLDCDDIWLPHKLEKQLPAFNSDSRIGLVFSNAVCFSKNRGTYQIYNRRKPPEGYVFRQLLKSYFLSLPTVIIKKEALFSLSESFDNRFSYIEDMDLFLRIAHDWRLGYVDEVLTKYRMHKESWTFKHGLFYFKEEELLIKKFLNLYPNFSKEYSNELNTMQMRIGYKKFCSYWINSKKKKARQCLKPFLGLDKRLLLPYIFSYFFPFSFYTFFLRMCGKKIYSP